jgi:diguanylate cyclase (GGDEF)-like protein/PAS domain S-box-containing protein
VNAFFDPSVYFFSWYAVPVVSVGALNWALGVATWRRERGSAISVTLLLMTLSIGVWLIGLGGANSTHSPDVALIWVKISLLGTVFVPVCAFTQAASGSSKLRVMRGGVVIGVLVSSCFAALVLSSDLLLDEVHHYFWGYYPIYGPAGQALIPYYGIFFVAGAALYRMGHQTTQSVTNRKRMKLRLAALLVALPATVDFLPTMHVGVYPFGYVFILGYVSIVTYYVWRYRIVDITPALAARQIIDTMAEGLIVADRDGTVRVANGAAQGVWGMSRSMVGLSVAELDTNWGGGALERLRDPEQEHELEVVQGGSDGSSHAAILSSSKLRDHLGEWVGTVFIIHDITERWRSEERFRSLVQNASDLITVIRADTTVLYQSPAIRRVLGYDPEHFVGAKLVDFVHQDDRAQFVATLGDLMTKPAGTIMGEGRVHDSEGAWRHLEFVGSDQCANPAIGGLVLNLRDMSERRELEEQLRYQALHDPLTRLANRTSFADRLEHALARRVRSRTQVAVLFLDLDDFKAVNDRFGHTAGDLLLTQLAERVTGCLRPGDTLARLGGDEFAVLLEDVGPPEDATAVAERVLAALSLSFDLDGKELLAGASIGIALTELEAAVDAETILRRADIAMYVAKVHGKGSYRVFQASMETSVVERLELLADLPRAVQQEEFILHYQPIFLLKHGGLFGVEALVRWQHPRRGLVQPDEFIPLAEESGAILPLGLWVLRQACAQAVRWQQKYPSSPRWTMSVNVSAKQLDSPLFAQQVSSILADTRLEPSRLVLELTESVMMYDIDLMLKRLGELKAVGVGLAIDDFGTGYSSLSYLRQFPFDLLKIDKSFIDDMGTIVTEKEVAKAIIEMGRTLDLEVVAEGIERGEQLSRLQALDCELGQGFLFAKPMEGHDIEKLFERSGAQVDAA